MFHSARLKLTAWYLVIIMTISAMFSIIIYRDLSQEINRFEQIQRNRIERRLVQQQPFPIPPPLPTANPELLDETRRRILFMLLMVNSGIFVLAGAMGYVLSGITLKPIKNMVDEQNRFISDASHELKTPLTSLKIAFEVYLREKNPTQQEAKILATESIDEVNKLQSLSDSLLQLAQYEKPREHIEFEKVSLSQIIVSAVKKMKPVADNKNISITSKTPDIFIIGNKYSLIDCLVILLDNAIKYSKEGSNISVSAGKTDATVTISVTDHGIGIAAEDLPHIFDRFFRADSARMKTKAGGYGLGLSIAEKIVHTHKGTIQIKSKVNTGTTVVIRLPVSFS
jgi:two-component system, OmpR family, sensor histidine kinase CiaH